MTGDCHAPFRGSPGVRLPRATRSKDGKRRRADCAGTSFTFLGYTFRARNAPTRDGTSMFTGFLPAVSKDALKRMSEEVRSWRIHLRSGTELQAPAERDYTHCQRMDELLRQVLQDRAGSPAAAHQHLPDALGTAEVQTATPVQEGPEMVEGPDRKAATPFRPLGLGERDRIRLRMRRAE